MGDRNFSLCSRSFAGSRRTYRSPPTTLGTFAGVAAATFSKVSALPIVLSGVNTRFFELSEVVRNSRSPLPCRPRLLSTIVLVNFDLRP